MCNTNALQQKIQKRTNNGDLIVNFLADTVEGKYTDAKYHHKLEAAKLLNRYGLADTTRHSREGGNPEGQGGNPEGQGGETGNSELNTHNSPVTHLDILNYEIAHLIRTETGEGHTIVEFLGHVMTVRDKPFTPKKLRIRHTDRMAAAREIIRRGFGHFGRRRKLVVDDYDDTNDYDTLHTDLAKRMREYGEHGADAVRFLLDVMNDDSLDPEEAYAWHHRMSAAQELIRRGWDTNYDKITPEMLQAYWRDKESTRLSVGQKKHLAGLPTSLDDYDTYDHVDYNAIAQQLREDEDEAHDEAREVPNPATKLLLPKGLDRSKGSGEGKGEGNDNRKSPPSPSSKSAPIDDDRKAIIKEFKEAMAKGDERAALRAQTKYRRIDTPSEKNIYDYGPNDPDPTIDYYYEPLNPEEQAKFDEQDRREHGLTEEEIADLSNTHAPRAKSDPLKQLAQAAAREGVPIHPNPLAAKQKNPTIRSP